MTEKEICCWTTGKWVKFIGWAQIIVNAVILVGFSTFLASVLSSSLKTWWLCTPINSEESAARWRTYDDFSVNVPVFGAWISRVLLDALLSLLLGVTLLFGSFQRKPRLLVIWVTSTIMWLIMLALLSIILWFYYNLESYFISIEFVIFFGYVSIKLFCILVVATHKEDCEMDSNVKMEEYNKF